MRFIVLISLAISIISCGGKKTSRSKQPTEKSEAEKKWKTNTGVGPVSSISLEDIDVVMVEKGEKLYKSKCVACHKTTQAKLIGPGLGGILKRRTPEWTMNMIINPQKMIKEDPLAREVYKAYRTPMLNLGIKEKEAREILEYLRTL